MLISCNSDKKKDIKVSESKKIEIGINHTIETFMILRSLDDNDPHFKYRKSEFKDNPLVYFSRQFFKNYGGHIAVHKTQEIIKEFGVDVTLQGLLYSQELPNVELIYEVNSPDWKQNREKLIEYLNLLKKFYVEANVYEFINQHKAFYLGAIAEAKSHIKPNLIQTMENYFGTANDHYSVILAPNQPFGMGFGADVENRQEKILYQILAPANGIEWKEKADDYSEFGYSGNDANEYYRDLVVHEFCHSFITPIIEQEEYKAKINQSDSLFIPKLDSLMTEQGYDNWWSFVNEHLVRLGEIRISKKIGTDDLEEMRNYNIKENGFILIPDAEQLIIEYETNRKEYPKFELFLPKLVEQLNSFNKIDIKNKMAAANNGYK